MKRSDMIQLLSMSFFKHMNNTLLESDRDMYSAILMDLEKAGMLPQLIDKVIEGHVCGANEWEAE